MKCFLTQVGFWLLVVCVCIVTQAVSTAVGNGDYLFAFGLACWTAVGAAGWTYRRGP